MFGQIAGELAFPGCALGSGINQFLTMLDESIGSLA